MKRLWGRVLAGLSLLAGAGAICSACAHDDTTIYVQAVLAPQLVSNGQVCTYTNDPTQPIESAGTLDVAFRNEYTATFLLANQLVPAANTAQLRTESSTVTVQGAVVRITDSNNHQLNTFTRLASANIAPANGGTPSYQAISITIIDRDTINNDSAIQTQVLGQPRDQAGIVRLVTYVRFFGKTLGGQSVESGEFAYPVDVCRGCLIQFGPLDVNSCFSTPNCIGTGMSSMQLPVPCFPGQDAPVDCSQCLDIPDCNPPAKNLCGDGGTGADGSLFDAGGGGG